MAEFQKPLGLVLSGGGSLGCWQGAALRALEKAGVSFDCVLGVSAGALNGAGYAFDLGDEIVDGWGRLERSSVLRFSPRLFPLSIFSDKPVHEALAFSADDQAVREHLRCRLVVASTRADRKRRDYAVFEPGGRWDGPLHERLVATCAIPIIFPSVALGVDGGRARYLDGSVWCEEHLSFDAVASCRDVIVIETVRADELGRRPRGFLDEFDLRGRQMVRGLMSQGAAGLRARPNAPRLFRLAPSRPLPFSQLSFSKKNFAQGSALGAADAEAFLRRPEAALAS